MCWLEGLYIFSLIFTMHIPSLTAKYLLNLMLQIWISVYYEISDQDFLLFAFTLCLSLKNILQTLIYKLISLSLNISVVIEYVFRTPAQI